MNSPHRLGLGLAIVAAFCGLATAASARSGEWKNAKGESFEADPSDIVGPWALFAIAVAAAEAAVELGLVNSSPSPRTYDGPGRDEQDERVSG